MITWYNFATALIKERSTAPYERINLHCCRAKCTTLYRLGKNRTRYGKTYAITPERFNERLKRSFYYTTGFLLTDHLTVPFSAA